MHSVLIKGDDMSSFQGCPYRGAPLYEKSYIDVVVLVSSLWRNTFVLLTFHDFVIFVSVI